MTLCADTIVARRTEMNADVLMIAVCMVISRSIG